MRNNINTEELFDKVVVECNGVRVSTLFKEQIKTLNADYYFGNEKIVAELKCFESHVFNAGNGQVFESLIESWIKNKEINESNFLDIILGRETLPKRCLEDLTAQSRKAIDRVIEKANKQILSTKLLLDKPDAQSILLLCNDGNYFLQNKSFISIVCELMQNKYLNSEIDCFVYFTNNLTSSIPFSEVEWQLWAPVYRDENNKVLSDFVNNLGSFFDTSYERYHDKKYLETKKVEDTEEGIEFIKMMKYIKN